MALDVGTEPPCHLLGFEISIWAKTLVVDGLSCLVTAVRGGTIPMSIIHSHDIHCLCIMRIFVAQLVRALEQKA